MFSISQWSQMVNSLGAGELAILPSTNFHSLYFAIIYKLAKYSLNGFLFLLKGKRELSI